MMTVGSLFSGIGGIDLGLERTGYFKTAWFVEREPFCQKVLAKHWPSVPCYDDVTTLDWGTLEPVDVLAGGFPCQPVSIAGKRQGQSDERWLWPYFAEGIEALQPKYVLIENVEGLKSAGYRIVETDLVRLGYIPYPKILTASEFGAPHARKRLFVVAHADGLRSPWGGRRSKPRST